MWISLHTLLAAETQLANGEVLQVQVSRDEILKLRGRTRIPVMCKGDAQHFKPE